MAGPRTKKAQKRDKNLCGVHLGGCGELVPPKNDVRSLDHIMPEAWFKTAGKDTTPTDYDDLWNRQLMHKGCDNKKGGAVLSLPPFWCHCHYLEVRGRDLFVVVRDSETGELPERHLLLKGYVAPPSDDPFGLSLYIAPISNNPKSWPKDGVLRTERPDHHHLVSLRPEWVASFNREQISRANRVFETYNGSPPDFSIRDAGYVWDKDLSKFAPKRR